jgi:hypothetical protein
VDREGDAVVILRGCGDRDLAEAQALRLGHLIRVYDEEVARIGDQLTAAQHEEMSERLNRYARRVEAIEAQIAEFDQVQVCA